MTDLNIERALYQLIIHRLDGNNIGSKLYRERIISLVEKGIGGFILFGGKRDEVSNFIKKIQSLSEIPLFIASDVERGIGQQIKGTNIFPSQMAIASAINKEDIKDVSLLKDLLDALSMEAIDVGINIPLIPVLDINQDPENPIICTRSFSGNRDEVSWFGAFYIKVLQKNGLISCAKHFPGHGDTSIDSHITLPTILKSKNELLKMDLYPFIEAIKSGVKGIMVGHLLLPSLDSRPATISRKIVTDLLRNELGFNGLVLSDALNMNAIKDIDNVALNCLQAGIDILLHPLEPEKIVKKLTEAILDKKLRIEDIEERLDKIFKIKSELKKILNKSVNYEKNRKLSELLTERAITIYKGSKKAFAIKNLKGVDVYVFGEKDFYDKGFLKRFFNYPKVKNCDTTIIVIFKSISAWKGGIGLQDSEIEDIKRIIGKSKISYIISFGNPYVLRHFKEADFLIATYDTSLQAQKAMIKALKGDIDLYGRMPVKINYDRD